MVLVDYIGILFYMWQYFWPHTVYVRRQYYFFQYCNLYMAKRGTALGYCISVWCKNRISYESTQLRTNLSSSSRQECWLSATPPYTAPVSWLSLRSFLASVPNVVMNNSWVMLMLSNIHPNNRCVGSSNVKIEFDFGAYRYFCLPMSLCLKCQLSVHTHVYFEL
jgi:hypothetical protein